MAKKSKKYVENELLEYILEVGKSGEMKHKKYINALKTYNKKYEAQRSTLGLSYGDSVITQPWLGASDFGFPIEAITIDNLVVREYKAKFTSRPAVQLKPLKPSARDFARIAEEYLDYKLHHKIPFFTLRKKMADRIKNIEGGYIGKIINTEYKFWETTGERGFILKNKLSKEYMIDEEGNPVFFEEGTEPKYTLKGEVIRDIDWEKEPVSAKEERTYFKGTKYIVKHYSDFIVPEDADTPFINDLDWIIDISKYSTSDLRKMKKNFPAKEKKKIEELIDNAENDTNHNNTEKITLWEFWGSYDIDNDGLDEEIRVIMSPEYNILIGWEENPYGGSKPYFHHFFKERNCGFHGVGIPEFFRGIRGVLDNLVNANLNRRSIADNPPILVNAMSGYDPDLCEVGPGEIWLVDDHTGIRELPLSKGEQSNLNDIQLLMGLAQKIYGGVSDYATGMESQIPSNKTATGISAIIAQGNIQFQDIVDQDQKINEQEYMFMMKYMFPEDIDEIEGEDFVVLDEEDPFKKITKDQITADYLIECVTTDVNERKEVKYQRYINLLQLILQSQDPLIIKDYDLRAKIWDEILDAGFRGLKTRGADALRQEELLIKTKALQSQIEQIAGIQDERARQSRLKAAETVGGQIGEELANEEFRMQREGSGKEQ